MSSRFKRVLWIVLDSVGIGAMPDASEYGDAGSDTLGHVVERYPIQLPNLLSLGLGNIKPFRGLSPAQSPTGAFGMCSLCSPGKDTTTGHWEMAGILLRDPLPLYPNGFPPDIIQPFQQRIGREVLGNKAASGTEILKELGDEHVRTGRPIVYTSADSVFQIAAHEEVIPLSNLLEMCAKARSLLTGPHEVGRVIARPFAGSSGQYRRTANRKDFAIPPPEGMLLDRLSDSGTTVTAVGKIGDIFAGRGITCSRKTRDNDDGMSVTNEILRQQESGLIWLNLVDFDQLFGHRNDVEGYARALEAVDVWLPSIPRRVDDLVIITADHGCDPTTDSTDHSREYTPLIVYGDCVRSGTGLGVRSSLADIGQTVADNFGTHIDAGISFLPDIWKG
jgi:phosphopentomutase